MGGAPGGGPIGGGPQGYGIWNPCIGCIGGGLQPRGPYGTPWCIPLRCGGPVMGCGASAGGGPAAGGRPGGGPAGGKPAGGGPAGTGPVCALAGGGMPPHLTHWLGVPASEGLAASSSTAGLSSAGEDLEGSAANTFACATSKLPLAPFTLAAGGGPAGLDFSVIPLGTDEALAAVTDRGSWLDTAGASPFTGGEAPSALTTLTSSLGGSTPWCFGPQEPVFGFARADRISAVCELFDGVLAGPPLASPPPVATGGAAGTDLMAVLTPPLGAATLGARAATAPAESDMGKQTPPPNRALPHYSPHLNRASKQSSSRACID